MVLIFFSSAYAVLEGGRTSATLSHPTSETKAPASMSLSVAGCADQCIDPLLDPLNCYTACSIVRLVQNLLPQRSNEGHKSQSISAQHREYKGPWRALSRKPSRDVAAATGQTEGSTPPWSRRLHILEPEHQDLFI